MPQLSDEERMIRGSAGLRQERLMPRCGMPSRGRRTDRSIFNGWANLACFGPTIPEQYSGAALNLHWPTDSSPASQAGRFRLPLDDERAVSW